MDSRNSVLNSETVTLRPYGNFFRTVPLEVEKCIMWESVLVLPSQESEKSLFSFEDIDLRESHAK